MAWICKQFAEAVGYLAMLTVLLVFLAANVGCAPNTEPIERGAMQAFNTVVAPAVEKGITELGTTSAAIQGQGSLLEPGYEMEGYGFFGSGIVWKASVRLIGVSANLSGATQAAATQPAAKEPDDVVSGWN